MMKRGRRFLLGLLCCAALSPASAAEPQQPPFGCLVEPDVVLNVSSPVDGVIAAVDVERGDRIHVDQVLFRLESATEEAALSEARARAESQAGIALQQAQVTYARRRLARLEELHRSKSVSAQERDAAQLEAQLAELELQKARDDKRFAELQSARAKVALDRRTVRSPIDGIVTDRFLAAGEYVKERPVLKIARIDPLRVEVVLPAEQFGSLQPGMSAEVTPLLTGAKPSAAEVTQVDPILDTASGMFRVSLRLPNPEHAIPGGVECTVRFAPL
ncbi:MAG: efflux RND transporter periplasmic adaptor subunit [Gammaproteobacteria bacterium]|nr:efflux RND transporter periplasmic adaptor subunit [Gammaproteobacteria bacterium]